MADKLKVQVAYALPDHEQIVNLEVEAGTTILQAIAMSGLGQYANHTVGIFGKKQALETVLRDQDRVEIYRPLIADPKDSRRRRAHRGQTRGL